MAMAAAAAFSLEEGSQGKQGMARQEKAWMAWGTILTGHGVMNGASEIFFLFNWRCQKPFIHCTAKLQMVP